MRGERRPIWFVLCSFVFIVKCLASLNEPKSWPLRTGAIQPEDTPQSRDKMALTAVGGHYIKAGFIE